MQWRLKSPASPLFTQPFMLVQIKESIKSPHHWPLCGEFTGDQWIPCTKASGVEIWCFFYLHQHKRPVTRKMFPFDDVIMPEALWPSDGIWQHRFRSTLTQIMACCLTTPSHYLNRHWLIMNEVLWHSPDINFTGNTQYINLFNEFENHAFKIIATYLIDMLQS